MIWEMLYGTLFFIVPIVGMLTIISVESLKCRNTIGIEVIEHEEKTVNGTRLVNVITRVEKLMSNYYGKIRPCDQNAQGIVIDLNDYRKKMEKRQKGRVYARDGPYNTS